MDKRLVFGEDTENYDKWRPQYSEELFHTICQAAAIGHNSYVLEIGCGTGQATKPILEAGCHLTALDYSKEMIAFIQDKYGQYPNLRTCALPFEDFTSEPNHFDLVFSATAFHWIMQPQGNQKIMRCLKKGGKLAVFWNRPFVNSPDDPMHQAIQSVYKNLRKDDPPPKKYDEKLFQAIQQGLLDSGFSNLEFHLFESTRRFTANDYIRLLNTYSDHRTMAHADKKRVEDQIATAIEKHGKILTVYDVMDLYIVEKP